VLEKAEFIDRVLFTRWAGAPTTEDLQSVERMLATMRTQLGKNLVYVGSVHPSSKIPNSQERQNVGAMLKITRQYCDRTLLILEGNELHTNLIRAVLSGVLLVSRSYDGFFAVHRSGKEVAEDLQRSLNLDGANLIQRARANGLVL
jgi:hypothetical protein